MADLTDDQFVGCWFNAMDPYYGYLKIFPYSHEYNGGDAIAMVHAHHGENEPVVWYRGVWKPTRTGYEVWCGPYHWKNIAMFSTPETENGPMMLFFRSKLNGWGACNMGRLPDNEEKELLDSLKGIPEWQNEISYPKDNPNDLFEHNRKYLSHNGRLEYRDKRKKKMAKEGITEPGNGAPWTPVANKRSGTGPGTSEGGPVAGGDSGNGDNGGGDKPSGDGDGGNGGSSGGESGGKGDDAGKADAASGSGKQQQQSAPAKQSDQSKNAKAEGKSDDSGKKTQQSAKDSGKGGEQSGSDDDSKSGGKTWDRDGDGNVLDDFASGRFFKGKKDTNEE